MLLIGSTGNGKSTLGNFLLDPDDVITGGKHFAVSQDNKSKTNETSIKTFEVTYQLAENNESMVNVGHVTSKSEDEGIKSTEVSVDISDPDISLPEGTEESNSLSERHASTNVFTSTKTELLTVIDTPGLNESPIQDLKHMIDLVKTLHQYETVQACIFVVKFSTRIDQQYKETITYYKKQLPELFRHDCMIIMTDYATDRRSIAGRRKQGIDTEEIITNVRNEVKKCSGICFDPIVFALDCFPFEDELATAKNTRCAIIFVLYILT